MLIVKREFIKNLSPQICLTISAVYFFLSALQAEQLRQSEPIPHPQSPRIRFLMILVSANMNIAKSRTEIMIVASIQISYIPTALPMRYTASEQSHAITHCQITTPAAHFVPSSRFIEAIAATHGV